MTHPDPGRFPRLRAYIDALPDGLASHIQCQCKASVIGGALDALPGALDTDALPDALSELIEHPPPRSAWIPETLNMAVYLAAADSFFETDEAFLQWVYEVGEAVFRSPMYRILMLVASPERLAKGAVHRWSAFHRGSAYELERVDWGTVSTIAYPQHLFPKLGVQATSMAIQAAYRACGARRAKVDVIEWKPTQATIRSVWHPET